MDKEVERRYQKQFNKEPEVPAQPHKMFLAAFISEMRNNKFPLDVAYGFFLADLLATGTEQYPWVKSSYNYLKQEERQRAIEQARTLLPAPKK